ncbi:hypothetical protein [Oecophyllibacter saccharovorans]|uniref:hypothetical protein n=1 Tax=Oecophyllibacter saccharovorans TaxID=2558360 RepID=UPI00116DF349|nr:hypothetical protein [Oecophyllibacter saccharovorans]TPW36624.1 hypothetical protein E3203_02355 [Oecophyllibacter saccharovorans]
MTRLHAGVLSFPAPPLPDRATRATGFAGVLRPVPATSFQGPNAPARADRWQTDDRNGMTGQWMNPTAPGALSRHCALAAPAPLHDNPRSRRPLPRRPRSSATECPIS